MYMHHDFFFLYIEGVDISISHKFWEDCVFLTEHLNVFMNCE